MFGHVVPPVLTRPNTSQAGPYRCPLCEAQTTAGPADPGWVRCPMIGEKPICLGCCIDHQKPARAEHFEDHPLYYLFEELARSERQPIETLRRTCLGHQLELVADDQPELRSLIERALARLGPSPGHDRGGS